MRPAAIGNALASPDRRQQNRQGARKSSVARRCKQAAACGAAIGNAYPVQKQQGETEARWLMLQSKADISRV